MRKRFILLWLLTVGALVTSLYFNGKLYYDKLAYEARLAQLQLYATASQTACLKLEDFERAAKLHGWEVSKDRIRKLSGKKWPVYEDEISVKSLQVFVEPQMPLSSKGVPVSLSFDANECLISEK